MARNPVTNRHKFEIRWWPVDVKQTVSGYELFTAERYLTEMERFRKDRLIAEGSLVVETGDGPVKVSVVDVNEYGMRICGNMNVAKGEDITASLSSWEVSGAVRWVGKPYCGILFDSRAPKTAISELRGSIAAPYEPKIRRIRMKEM